MAKSKTELVPAVVPFTEISVCLDKDDVASILTSRAEEFLKGEIKKCKACRDKCDTEGTKLRQHRDRLLQEAAEEHFASTVKTLTKAATALKATHVEATVCCSSHHIKGQCTKRGEICCQLVVTGANPSIHWTVNQSRGMLASVNKVAQAISRKQDELAANETAWLELRRKLADLPAIERRARAAVAEQRLQSTAEGRELIAILDDNLKSSIELLG